MEGWAAGLPFSQKLIIIKYKKMKQVTSIPQKLMQLFSAFALILFVQIIPGNSIAQQSSSYKKFRVDMGFAAPDNPGKKLDGLQRDGFGFYIEPNYVVKGSLALGLRYMFNQTFSYDGNYVSNKDNNIILAMATVREKNGWNAPMGKGEKSRLSAGIGIGLNRYHNKADTAFFKLQAGEQREKTAVTFACMPRIGYEYGRFNLGIDYTYTGNPGANFFQIELGFYLGGGRLIK